jgi:hypothetical protein
LDPIAVADVTTITGQLLTIATSTELRVMHLTDAAADLASASTMRSFGPSPPPPKLRAPMHPNDAAAHVAVIGGAVTATSMRTNGEDCRMRNVMSKGCWVRRANTRRAVILASNEDGITKTVQYIQLEHAHSALICMEWQKFS